MFIEQRPKEPPLPVASTPAPIGRAEPAGEPSPEVQLPPEAQPPPDSCEDLTPIDLSTWTKVRELLENANGRIIYGRGPEKANMELKYHEMAINKAAVELLHAKPQLIGWQGSTPMVGDLLAAARLLINKVAPHSAAAHRAAARRAAARRVAAAARRSLSPRTRARFGCLPCPA